MNKTEDSVSKTLNEIKEFKSINSIITSLKTKTDIPLSFTQEEEILAEGFFKANNYFSFSIYRKLLPRIEGKEYSFTDALNLYKFNTFLRENLIQFTGHIEIMMKSTLIQEVCTYYELKNQEDKLKIAFEAVDETINTRKRELNKKYKKLKNKKVELVKLVLDLEKKFSGSAISITEISKEYIYKYAKELTELMGKEARVVIIELIDLIRNSMVKGINDLANISLELLVDDIDNGEISFYEIKQLFIEKIHILIADFDKEVEVYKEKVIEDGTNWLQYNMFKYSTGECYLDLSIYTRNNEANLIKSLEIIDGFKEVITEDGDKSDAIKHYLEKGLGVPIWVIMDEITFGKVYNFATVLSDEFRNSWICNSFTKELNDYILGWFRAINFLRNACAHYTRLYGRYFTASPPKLIKEDLKLAGITADKNRSLFANMLTMKNLLKFHSDGLGQWNSFIDNLENEISKYGDIIRISEMGFPENWKKCLTT